MAKFRVDTMETGTHFPHYWEQCVGSCRAYTALRADYRKQLKKAHDELGFQYIRFHGLLNDDMSVCLEKKDFSGKSHGIVYNFVNVDNIFDFLLEIGMKPFIEFGFMPTCLASGDQSCFNYKGNITPPKDFDAWGELIDKLVSHLVERYGIEEVRTWFFEVWNEPNLAYFWTGTKEEYFKMYEVTAHIIKNIDSQLRVGGPATSINAWIPEMIEFCETKNVPLDYISTHHYPSDDPLWRDQTMSITEAFKSGKLGKYQRGVLKEMTAGARKEAGNYPLYYTEWNISGMTGERVHDVSYASAMIAKILADNDQLVQGYSFWTFSDIFEEMGQLAGAFHGGFGLMNYYGIEKPAYRLFELYHKLGTKRLQVTQEKQENEHTEMLVTKTDEGIQAVLYNHNILDEEISEEKIQLEFDHISNVKSVKMIRIDDDHANPRIVWEQMGAPQHLNKSQEIALFESARLVEEDVQYTIQDNKILIECSLPPHGVIWFEILGELETR